jgi:outer membrane protein TolC
LARLWHDYYYLGRALAVTGQNHRLLADLESVLLAQYAAGRAGQADVVRLQLELARQDDRLRSLRDRRRPLVAALNAELDRPLSAPIAWPDTLAQRTLVHSLDQLHQLLAERNPRLLGQRSRIAENTAATELAGKSALPDLTLGLEYIDTGPARSPDVPDSGRDAVIARASFSLPLWFGQHRAAKAEAAALRAASEGDLVRLHNRLRADLEQAHFALRDAERRLKLYTTALLPQARQALAVTERSFSAGEGAYLDLIDSQRTLLELELAQARAQTDHATQLAVIEQLVGFDVTEAPEQEMAR